jgi:hypothetical protein
MGAGGGGWKGGGGVGAGGGVWECERGAACDSSNWGLVVAVANGGWL